LICSALLLGGAAPTIVQQASAVPAPLYVTVPLNLPGTGWTQLIYEQGYPNVTELIQSIYAVAATLAIADPGLLTDSMTFYAYNGKKYSPAPEEVLLGSEYAAPDVILFYNPSSPHIIARRPGAGLAWGAPASDAKADRLLGHEMGHVKWHKMTQHEKDAWLEVYELSKALDVKRPTNGYTKKDGTTGNYYDDFGAEEGFCEAFADHYTKTDPEVELDKSITNFLDNLPKA
jgi:hypothetical protein